MYPHNLIICMPAGCRWTSFQLAELGNPPSRCLDEPHLLWTRKLAQTSVLTALTANGRGRGTVVLTGAGILSTGGLTEEKKRTAALTGGGTDRTEDIRRERGDITAEMGAAATVTIRRGEKGTKAEKEARMTEAVEKMKQQTMQQMQLRQTAGKSAHVHQRCGTLSEMCAVRTPSSKPVDTPLA